MNIAIHTARNILLGTAVAAALIGPGAGIALAESPARQFEPGLSVGTVTPPPADPGDILPPPPDPDPANPDDFLPPPADPVDPGHGGPGDLGTDDDEPPVDPCEVTNTCPTPPCDPEVDPDCPTPPCDPEEDPDCPVVLCDVEEGTGICPPCEADDTCDQTTTPLPETEDPEPVSSDRPTFDTGDEQSVAGAGLVGGGIGLIIAGGTAVAVFRRPIK
ncbi:hypothetical protein [Gordonia rhizosphera]|uniref:Gram-positive cocci surface proteins LPxTG domain-containing protein n=1 Tax=Gordonia rhizosphera NBRC 16068 TaxID=1108045 RepID=K6V5G4_9ACTN|nr:hypothetical protein [Gordonia rhizosphera]GAB91478.1 hypothetical protein GORHZ_135_00270 [Gordonia rhizosphera NBRC 16068]